MIRSNMGEVLGRFRRTTVDVGTRSLQDGTARVVEDARAAWPVKTGESAAALQSDPTPVGASVRGASYTYDINGGTTADLLLALPLRGLGDDVEQAVARAMS